MTSLHNYIKQSFVFILSLLALFTPVVVVGQALATTTSSSCKVGTEKACSMNSGSCSTSNNGLNNCPDPAANPNANGPITCTITKCDLIKKYVDPLITLLSALVGIAVTISIIIGGIQYSSSNGNAQQVTAAKARIRNSIIALLAFFFLYALLQFLVPGGIFRT